MFSEDRVQFERPDLGKLTADHTVFDLHFHTQYSDGLSSIEKTARQASKLGLGIAITDHNEIRGALEIEKKYPDVLSIPGIEVTSAEGTHLLIYFYDSHQLECFYRRSVAPHMGNGLLSSLDLPMTKLIERARDYHCLIVFPHPYSAMYTGVYNAQFSKEQTQRLLMAADGVEVINANNLKKWNLKCALMGFNLGKSMVGGSDGHALHHMGRAVSYARCPRTRYDFLEAIRHGANRVIGKEISLMSKLTSNGLKFRSNIRNSPELFEKNMRYSKTVISLKAQYIRTNIRRRLLMN